MSSCGQNNKKDDSFDYDDLYRTIYENPFPEIERLTSKAKYGYILNDKQGYNSWFYLYRRNGVINQMTYKNNKFMGVDSSMDLDIIRTKKDETAIRQFISNMAGPATIYGNYKSTKNNKSDALIKIYLNSELIYEDTLEKDDLVGKYFAINKDIDIDDNFKFEISGDDVEISFEPVVTIENSQDMSLYHLNDSGHIYGDVFPWYNEEEHKLYTWYLWSDDVPRDGFLYSLDISSNLIKNQTFEPANNYDLYYKIYSNYFYSQIFDVQRFIDSSLYDFGVRDNMLYHDKENHRYILIAGCYRRFDTLWDSDLMIYVSDDDMALSWSRAGNKIASYMNNLPECPSLLKIGNRWYSFVSVSHITDHQIGPLQYWIGDENVDCMDVDWSNKEFLFLDGEDLCAARPTQIGDKTYMWGWIVNTYNGIPMAPWAGYLNLPREVVSRDDGSLGGRMDPGLTKYINYGNLFSENERVTNDEMSLLQENNKRNFVTFDVDLSNCDEASYCIVQDDKLYKCSLIKEDDKTYMQISSPDESKHKINSKIEIYQPSKDNKYSIKIVIDGRFIEMFANEDNALTASTAMNDNVYSAYLSSTGQAKFQNIKINKLRSYGDCD